MTASRFSSASFTHLFSDSVSRGSGSTFALGDWKGKFAPHLAEGRLVHIRARPSILAGYYFYYAAGGNPARAFTLVQMLCAKG